MNKYQHQVEQFMTACGHAKGTKPGEWAEEGREKLCYNLIDEEATELLDALEAGDVVEALDGACDLIYVVLYFASSIGIDLTPFFDEVQATNMLKAECPRDPVTGKQTKPPGLKPKIKELLDEVQERYRLQKG